MLIIITKEESEKWLDYNVLSFPEIECTDVEDLTSYYNPNLDNTVYSSTMIAEFQRILKIKLKNSGNVAITNAINSLSNREDIDYVGPNYSLKTKILEKNDLNLCDITRSQSIDQWGNDTINLDEANQYIGNYTKNNVLVGVIDKGVEEHIDIKYRISEYSHDCSSNNNGQEIYDGDPLIDDGGGHGTMISGIISGLNINGTGISGINSNAYIVSLKQNSQRNLSNNSITNVDSLIRAISYAGSNHIRVINISFGYPVNDQSLKVAVRNYPGLVVCAAGNEGSNLDINKLYPQCYDLENIITVGALSETLTYCGFSNYGSTEVDIYAPGENIWSTSLNDTYFCDDGTSYAAPFVAGVAALIISIEQNTDYGFFNAKFIKQIIINSATLVASLSSKCVSGGYLNAEREILEAFNYYTSYEPTGLVYHKVIPKYAYSYLEEHEWSFLVNNHGIVCMSKPPLVGSFCVKCGTSKV